MGQRRVLGSWGEGGRRGGRGAGGHAAWEARAAGSQDAGARTEAAPPAGPGSRCRPRSAEAQAGASARPDPRHRRAQSRRAVSLRLGLPACTTRRLKGLGLRGPLGSQRRFLGPASARGLANPRTSTVGGVGFVCWSLGPPPQGMGKHREDVGIRGRGSCRRTHSFFGSTGLKSTYYVADTVIAPRKPQPLRTTVFWKPRRRRKPGAREGGAQKGQMLEKTPVPGATQENPLLSCPEASQPSMTFLILSPGGGFHSQDSCWAVR